MTAVSPRIDKAALAGKKILLVEDNDINAEIATLVLSEYGLVVDRASNGQEGVDRIVEKGGGYYDVVLMDIQMPVMNGHIAKPFDPQELAAELYRRINAQ